MLDLKFIRDNADAVRRNIANRFMTADLDKVIALYEERNRLLNEVDDLRRQRNENAAKMKGKLPPEERAPLVEEGKRLKEDISGLEERLKTVSAELKEAAEKIPNMAHPDAPVGKEDKDNLEIRRFGEPASFDFPAKDHVQLAQELDLVDFDTAAKVSGTKFYYLKNEAVFLELALIRYAMDILQKKGFTPTITPDIAKEEILEGIGFNPRGSESNIYSLEGTGTCLVGTAEITLGGYHSDSILDAADLPLKMAGFSHCFRREAGAAGQFSKGLYRVHQFSKVEMFVYCTPDQSEEIHQELLALEEEIFKGLEVPFRVVDTCTGDLGSPAYRKYDLEAWMPGRGEAGDWGEVTSTSNCTDYQSRRLGVRFKDEGRNSYVHMLNGTAVAVSRAIIAILENFQQADGSVRIPPALVPYTGFDTIRPK
ncbi:serine--tRNA ligase [Marispirochaeta aestuarii]|uniref:serine--tRNA ligase n=1 Tax=Marispirochaeta aestuarii TaxID=1963862 RepID=UPI002ABDD8DB|nr:serine--tRNA ligase [Marispirochaeta aestuarii]